MPLNAKTRPEAVDLIGYEADFERSGISGRIVRDTTACPRQGDLNSDTYGLLLRQISRGLVQYVVFSGTTPIAWVYTNGSVSLPEIKYDAVTTEHQQMVREAFGGLVNNNLLPEPLEDKEPMSLSENEEIILRRMRDEDGTEYDLVFKGPACKGDQQRLVPRDQAETLVLKGLATYLVGTDCYGEWGIVLSPKGRAHLDKIAPVKEPSPRQYEELTQDELVNLADELGHQAVSSQGSQEGKRILLELAAVLGALKARNDAGAPARRRIGEYLRQVSIKENEKVYLGQGKGEDGGSYGRKKVDDLINSLRVDQYSGAGNLLLSDIRFLVPTLVRDTKAEFFEKQEARAAGWLETPEGKKLPEKQKAVLPCVAKGHIQYDYRGWRGTQSCCQRTHGATLAALAKKTKIVTTRTKIGMQHGASYMMLREVH